MGEVWPAWDFGEAKKGWKYFQKYSDLWRTIESCRRTKHLIQQTDPYFYKFSHLLI